MKQHWWGAVPSPARTFSIFIACFWLHCHLHISSLSYVFTYRYFFIPLKIYIKTNMLGSFVKYNSQNAPDCGNRVAVSEPLFCPTTPLKDTLGPIGNTACLQKTRHPSSLALTVCFSCSIASRLSIHVQHFAYGQNQYTFYLPSTVVGYCDLC